jgi:hypothetical protein
MKALILIGILALSACANTQGGADVRITPGGVSVSPVINTNVGGVGVTVSG